MKEKWVFGDVEGGKLSLPGHETLVRNEKCTLLEMSLRLGVGTVGENFRSYIAGKQCILFAWNRVINWYGERCTVV